MEIIQDNLYFLFAGDDVASLIIMNDYSRCNVIQDIAPIHRTNGTKEECDAFVAKYAEPVRAKYKVSYSISSKS